MRVSQGKAIVEQRKLSSIHLKHGNQVRGVEKSYSYYVLYNCMNCMMNEYL